MQTTKTVATKEMTIRYSYPAALKDAGEIIANLGAEDLDGISRVMLNRIKRRVAARACLLLDSMPMMAPEDAVDNAMAVELCQAKAHRQKRGSVLPMMLSTCGVTADDVAAYLKTRAVC